MDTTLDIHRAWDEALGARDVEASLALYHDDATLESPLVRRLMGGPTGIVRGRAQLRRFVERVYAHQPPERGRHRTAPLTDGERLLWEYPRAAPDGDQMDFVEAMEVRDGLIAAHRVYWGWFGLDVLARAD